MDVNKNKTSMVTKFQSETWMPSFDRSNTTQVQEHLNVTNPFCLVYNTALFANAQDACALLRRLT